MNVNTRDLGFVNFNGEEMNWVKFNGVTVYESWKEIIKSGVPPLNIYSSGRDLINYKMYGNSKQDGIPTPEAPIEVESVGKKTINEYDKKTYPLVDNRYISYSNGNMVTSATNTYKATEKYMLIKPNTTYSINYTASGSSPGIAFYDENYIYISGVKSGIGFTTPSNVKYMRFTVNIDIDIDTIQINEGSTILPFEPYGYRIPVKVSNGTDEVITNIYLYEPLRKINEHIDYINFESKKVYRTIQKLYIKDLTWTKHTSYSYVYSTYADILKGSAGVNPICNILNSTLYKPADSIRLMTTDYCIKMHNTAPSLYISDGVHTTVDEMMEYLGDGYFIFIAETPTEETIELPNIKTLKGNVTIEVVDDIQPSNMEVTYKGKN